MDDLDELIRTHIVGLCLVLMFTSLYTLSQGKWYEIHSSPSVCSDCSPK